MFKRAILDRFYIVTTFMIAFFAFWIVRMTFFGGGFLPFMILMLLAILTAAEAFTAFEIRRANEIMKADIEPPARPWYSSSFWSWNGVKERISSVRAWMAILYVFAAIFFSSIGVTLLALSCTGFLVLIFASGLFTPSNWTGSFNINENDASGTVGIILDPSKLQFTFSNFHSSDVSVPDQITWAYTSGWTISLAVFFMLLSLFFTPVIARHMADVARNLLGSTYVSDSISARFKDWNSRRK